MIISAQDKARVVEAIRNAERHTSGEIFCVITHASSSHRLVPVGWAALIAFAVPPPLIAFTSLPAGAIYLAQLAAFIVCAAIMAVPAVRYRIVPRGTLRGRAHLEATRQFLAHGLHLTEGRTGVLIFLSLAERYAEIVADAGIHQKVGPGVWERAIADLVIAIRDQRVGEGLATTVAACGAVLAAHFPPGALNHDELPDKVVEM